MRQDYIPWNKYCPRLPKRMTVQDLIQKAVNQEAEAMSEPVKAWKPLQVELPEQNLCPENTGVWNFAKGLMP